MTKKKITVAVSGLNNTDNPGPGIPVVRGIRESKEFDARIIGFAYENLEPGIYLHDIIDKTYQIPYPSAGIEPLMQRLEYINSIEKIDVIIPNFDAELFSFMKCADDLKKMNIHTFLPTHEQFEERQKSNLPDFGKKYGVNVPFSRPIFGENEIFGLTADFTYPLLVKGKYYDAYVAYNPEQVRMYFNKIVSKWGLPIIIQEFVHGTEVNVIALGDGKGNTIGAVPMRKQYITDKGKAWGGITLDDMNMLDLTHKIIGQTKWRGGMELELIKTNNNELFLIEINPRIPAWVYLAVGAGQNLPEALVKLALGEEVKPYESYDVGKMFVRYSMDMIVNLEEFEKLSMNGEL
ncbi:MAG: biotin carboxylase [Bacteroidetes bacterium RIFOXYA12_FULL_35_11]|nr:MAG: biotin carboxylase [Bacteroidetes bacterium GWF2_35_48]OFY73267.1 MAG: biotin carboxylase [Bacteroidetes bacterium RIFOXYA12_FULL_35_11]OFY94035.1 MAG: biotin carboxylase [Bacteroidetes bacterium RIFOXYC12_FULL_35_7]HBX52940.1 biotin carboxylase [Bacteroidales bacterium]